MPYDIANQSHFAATLTQQPKSSTFPSTENLNLYRSYDYSVDGQASPSVDAVRYSGAGRFWRPSDEENPRKGRIHGWRRWCNEAGSHTAASNPITPEERALENRRRRLSKSYSPEQHRAQEGKNLRLPNGFDTVAVPTVPMDMRSTGHVRVEEAETPSIGNLQQEMDTLALRIAANERKQRTREHLKRLQCDEEERLVQLEMLAATPDTPDLSSCGNGSSHELKNLALVDPAQPQNVLLEFDDEVQSIRTENSSHWDELRQLQSSGPQEWPEIAVNGQSLMPPSSPALSASRQPLLPSPMSFPCATVTNTPPSHMRAPWPHSSESLASASNSGQVTPQEDANSVFSDLDMLVGALRVQSRRTLTPSQKSIEASLSAKLGGDSKITGPQQPIFELSSSNSVVKRPAERVTASGNYSRYRDLKAKNAYPVELDSGDDYLQNPPFYEYPYPANEERIVIEPDMDLLGRYRRWP